MRTSMFASGAVIALAVLLAGCAVNPAPAPTPTPTSTTGSPTPTAPATASPTPMPTSSRDPNAPTGQCADADLHVTVQNAPDGGSAGHTNSQIVFTNTGTSSCELRGAPGVSVIDANGVQIGAAADRFEADTPPTVTLPSGGTAIASLSAVNIGSDGGPLADSCAVVQGAAYRVYPPHSFTAFEVPASVPACSSGTAWLAVMAVGT